MASVLGLFSTRVIDAEGITVAKELPFTFDDSATLANIKAFSDAYLAVLDPMTEGAITQQVFRIVLSTSGLKGAPIADSDVQETLLTSYIQNGVFSKWGDDIPAYIDAINVNGRINLANATLVSYAGFLTAAHAGFQAAGRTGNALVALYSGVETFRKRRKLLNAKSKTIA
jgi:hypothetical protein